MLNFDLIIYYAWRIGILLCIFVATVHILFKIIYTRVPKIFGDMEIYNIAMSYSILRKQRAKLWSQFGIFLTEIKALHSKYYELALDRWYKIWEEVIAFECDVTWPISGMMAEQVVVEKFSHTWDDASKDNKWYFVSKWKEYLFYWPIKVNFIQTK